MGTGKSTVGRLVAARLDRPFIDTDSAIVEWAGKPIAQIFAEQGEAAFRQIERRVCRFYAAQSGLVIATGGGALVDAENRGVMAASGIVICLLASVAAIAERLAGQTDRPLFSGDWQTLLAQRLVAYESIPHRIDTTDRAPDSIADEVIALWRQTVSA